MLKSLSYKKLEIPGSSTEDYRKAPFVLIDTNFSTEGYIPDNTPSSVAREVFVFLEYQKRKLAISKNVALLYVSYADHRSGDYMRRLTTWIDQDTPVIDKFLPTLEYGKKYAKCIKIQAAQLLLRKRYGN